MPTTKALLRDAISQHLLVHGPSSVTDIFAALTDAGVVATRTSSSVQSALRASPLAFQLPDERWDLTTRALAGVVLTVRVRSRLRDDVLWVHGDLEPFDGLLSGGAVPLSSGGSARLGSGQIRTLIGPAGWLPEVPPGELLGLRWTGHALDLFAVDATPETVEVEPIRQLLRRHRLGLTPRYGPPPGMSTVLLSVLREAPDLFAQPRLPLSEILVSEPLELGDTNIWEPHGQARRLTLHLPDRVYDELARRAELLGERLEDHAAVLLGAASDRVRVNLPDTRSYSSYDYGFDPEELGAVRSLRSVP